MATPNDFITCPICDKKIHSVQIHLEKAHPELSVEEFKKRFPDSPLLSQYAIEIIKERKKPQPPEPTTPMLHTVFGFPNTEKALLSSRNHKGIPITVLEKTGTAIDSMIPELNEGYVFNPIELKRVMLGVEVNIPVYVFGHKGAGKTELIEQICARTNRPLLRVQHTANTEESQIVGQWTVKNGETVFEYGPLPLAMINGWAYLADEYDFAMPNVLSVYQAVLEGKPLMIKEAPIEQRVVKPHPNFRFFATGNSNGTGDETGLYQGVNIQNSANYDRFGIVLNKKYLSKADEMNILFKNTKLNEGDAEAYVTFANQVRKAFDAGDISDTISPRSLLFAAKLGILLADHGAGLRLAFLNKLSQTDRLACMQFAQRQFDIRDEDD